MPHSRFLNYTMPLKSGEGQLSFVALVLMLYTIALFLTVTIHELLGHGVATLLVGGQFYAVYLSPGSGYISFLLPDTVSRSSAGFVYLAGILVEMLIGLGLIFFLLPRLKGFYNRLFTLVLSAVMLVHPAIYMFVGYFYPKGDTYHAAAVLGIEGDVLVVTGMILAGLFSLLVSFKVLGFLGSCMESESERQRVRILMLFWLPPLLLGVVSGVASSLFLVDTELVYAVASSGMLLLFIGMSIFLVPQLTDVVKAESCHITMKGVVTIFLVFILVLATWIGVFGPSESSAHGLMVGQPPLQVEPFYSDYTIGNAELRVFPNGTVGLSIHLLNMMDQKNSSALDRQIYATFADRPYWEYYLSRARNMVITMFDLPREVGQNLSFSTSTGVVRAEGREHHNGRICTTYLHFETGGTRQGMPVPQPGIGTLEEGRVDIEFRDPWHSRGGYLDEVRLHWDENVTFVTYQVYNDVYSHIPHNRGDLLERSIGWKNLGPDTSPSNYKFTLQLPQDR